MTLIANMNGGSVLVAPMGAGYQYCDEYKAVYDSMTNKPQGGIARAQNALVCALVDAGIWTILDVFYVFASHNISEALMNWASPGTHDATMVNSDDLTFIIGQGIEGGGINGYLRTHYNPNTDGINFSQNSGCIGLYIRSGVDINKWDFGANETGGPYVALKIGAVGMNHGINDAFGGDHILTDTGGIFMTNRTGATALKGSNNLSFTDESDVSTNLLNLELYIFNRNKAGSPGGGTYSAVECSFAWIAEGMTWADQRKLMYALEDYMDYWGAGVIDDDTFILQKYIDFGTTIPAGDYVVSDSIKIESPGTYLFEDNVTITCSDSFNDSEHSTIESKDRHAVFRVNVNNVTIDFNDTIINCNQNVLLAGNKFMNCVMAYQVSNCKITNIEGNNSHNTVLAREVTNIEVNNSELSSEESIGDDDYKNAALDIQICVGVTGSGFIGLGCEEVVDINGYNENVTITNVHGENNTEDVVEINDSKNVTVSNITGVSPFNNRLVFIQSYGGVPFPNENITLINMQDNPDYSNPGVIPGNITFYII